MLTRTQAAVGSALFGFPIESHWICSFLKKFITSGYFYVNEVQYLKFQSEVMPSASYAESLWLEYIFKHKSLWRVVANNASLLKVMCTWSVECDQFDQCAHIWTSARHRGHRSLAHLSRYSIVHQSTTSMSLRSCESLSLCFLSLPQAQPLRF